jgi:glycosyltransferase involved in cell wall biosynthesis
MRPDSIVPLTASSSPEVCGRDMFVCAFRGRRDHYQVPLALAEANALDQFITDAYLGPLVRAISNVLPRGQRETLRSREHVGIPRGRVRSLWATTALEHLRHRLGYRPSRTFALLDRRFSLVAAARARQTRSDLYLYSPYAWEAFRASYRHLPKRILFQFHPHSDLERRILLEDRAKYGFVQHSFAEDTGVHLNEDMRLRTRDCWRYADLIVCASSFTKQSMMEAGAPASLFRVVPYGIDLPRAQAEPPVSDQFDALFVGTGSQRKGLHHLLLAWERAVLPSGSSLTLVCRQIDPGIEALARRTANVRLILGADRAEITSLFRNSTILVMPSLIEGFGLVYLEALAEGCPVLGTPNSGLPDLGGEVDAIWQVQAGQIDQLISKLETLAQQLPGKKAIRERAQACAARWTWSHFRAGIRETINAAN